MALKGQKKVNYQREYMRLYRLKRKYPPITITSLDPSVRPEVDADGNIIYEE